jgi:hypothetical protein
MMAASVFTHWTMNQRQAIVLTARPTKLDCYVLVLHVARFAQALAECGDDSRIRLWRSAVKESNYRH